MPRRGSQGKLDQGRASRDWRGLVGAIERERLPMDLGLIVHAVRSREYMHDKFWRYLEMFSRAV